MPIRPFQGIIPQIDPTAFIHPDAVVIGDVWIGAYTSIWPGVVIRGDVNRIRLGDGSSIQDNSVLHVSRPTPELPEGAALIIGNGVTVAHHVILHGCELRDGCMIGMGAIVMDRVVVGSRAMIGAGALVPPGKQVAAATLWLGSPAKEMRSLTPQEQAAHAATAENYRKLAELHRES